MTKTIFSGSYPKNDVRFLLTPMTVPDTPVLDKEALIQSGLRHYSELLTHEHLPHPDYIQLFHQAMALTQQRLAQDLLRLAAKIVDNRTHGITLVSLARAGTPIGVLLKHTLNKYHGIDAPHYSISILRDKGLDICALRYLLQHHAPESLVFIDGWTGKGVIAQQLAKSLRAFSVSDGVTIAPELYVLVDLSGSAAVAASSDDYLIPSCILNSTVSGLISRSVYNKASSLATDFHGCVFYKDYAAHDLSNYFIATLLDIIDKTAGLPVNLAINNVDHPRLQLKMAKFIQDISKQYQVGHPNYIKPGIGEATRVLLRRKARLLLLRETNNTSTQHLSWLAQHKAVPIVVRPDLPYQAAALITEI